MNTWNESLAIVKEMREDALARGGEAEWYFENGPLVTIRSCRKGIGFVTEFEVDGRRSSWNKVRLMATRHRARPIGT